MTTYVKPVPVDNSNEITTRNNFHADLPNGEKVIYTDFDFNLNVHPITGDFTMVKNGRAIIQSLKNIILSATDSFLMEAGLGGGIGSMLFELSDGLTAFNLKTKLTDIIKFKEPRIILKDIEVTRSQDFHGLIVKVIFFYANTRQPITEIIKIERLR